MVLKKYGKNCMLSHARHSLYVLWVLGLLLVIIGSIIIDKHMDEADNNIYQHEKQLVLYGDDVDSRRFLGAIAFTLVISLPTIIDVVLARMYLHTWEELQQPIEFARFFIVLVLFIPNVFIFWEVIPMALIDLIMFFQYICLFFTLIFRIYTLSTASSPTSTSHVTSSSSGNSGGDGVSSSGIHNIYPVRDLFLLCICTMVSGFLFKLSTHAIISGRFTWKAIYTIFLVLLQVNTCMKLKPWFNFTWKISKVVKNHLLIQNKISFLAVMLGIVIATAMTVAHIVTFNLEYVYFPVNGESYVAMEWLFGAILICWTSIRNFEIRKAQLAISNQLQYNRKMTRSISHEIRTPLNTAFMALDLLISTLTLEQQQHIENSVPSSINPALSSSNTNTAYLLEIAESIKEGCDIALSILNQLLTYEKLSAGMLQLENHVFSVGELLEGNMKLFKMQAQQSGITFKLDRSNVDVNDLWVYVDEHKMNQVLRNLLSNAMKFTPRGGVVEVKLQWIHPNERESLVNHLVASKRKSVMGLTSTGGISSLLSGSGAEGENSTGGAKIMKPLRQFTEFIHHTTTSSADETPRVSLNSNTPLYHSNLGMRDCGTILISVVDSGPGVNEEDQRKLFQEYVQINPGELQKGQGTGLGLSISKSIVHLHGGNIGMTSDGVGKGSTFYIELPSYYKPLRDDYVLSDLYESVLDHSRIFGPGGASSKKLRRSYSGSSHKWGSHSHSHSRSHGSDREDHSLSDVHSINSPRRGAILNRVESFLSMGSRTPGRRKGSRQEPHLPADNTLTLGATERIKEASGTDNSPDLETGIRDNVNKATRMKPLDYDPNSRNGECSLMCSLFSNVIRYQSRVVPATIPVITGSRKPSHVQTDNCDKLHLFPQQDDINEVIKTSPSASVVPPIQLLSVSQDNTSNKNRVQTSFPSLPTKSYRILIVDDSIPNRKMLNRILTRDGHIVTEGGDGEEAVEIVHKSMEIGPKFDLILMDFYMPRMTGPEAVEIIRTKLGYTGVICGVSGVMDDDVHVFIDVGANLVLCKPISSAGIWKALRGTKFFDNQNEY